MRKRNVVIVSAIALLFLFVLAWIPSPTERTNTTETVAAQSVTSDVLVTGCVIRLYSTGPEIHADTWHVCNGADTVSINGAGDLLIESSHSTPVISVTAALDETLATRGILAGATQGVSTTVVRFYDIDAGVRVDADSSAVTGTYSNVWMTWVHEAPASEAPSPSPELTLLPC